MKKCVFVLMEYSDEQNKFYEHVLKPCLKEAGFICERADDLATPGFDIDDNIFPKIEQADVIIADLTGRNANVFYELGFSHSTMKKTMMISKDMEKLPFDINHYSVMEYDPKNFNKDLFISKINDTLAQPPTNPVTKYENKKNREDSLFSSIGIDRLLRNFQTKGKKVVFFDLDGTLFDSKKHRIKASIDAFRCFLPSKSDRELQNIYEDIYDQHAYYETIAGKNFRYDWYTLDIYKIAYLHSKGKIPDSYFGYLDACNQFEAKLIEKFENAQDIFCQEKYEASPYAKQFLEMLKLLDIVPVLVTEGILACQETKLCSLGLEEFFKGRIYVGEPYENKSNLVRYLNENSRASMGKDIRYAYDMVFGLYVKMLEADKIYFPAKVIQKLIKQYGSINLVVLGDRYSMELKPYEDLVIDKKGIIRIAKTDCSHYAEETKRDIEKTDILLKESFKDIAVELMRMNWKTFPVISNVTPIAKPKLCDREIADLEHCKSIIQSYNKPEILAYIKHIEEYYGIEENIKESMGEG